MYTDLKGGRFALLFDHDFDFLLRLLDHLFDSGRVNTPVHNELFKCDPCNLSSDRIKAGENNRFGRIVNDQIYARHRLKSSDISSLSADDPAFHLIIGKLYHRNSGLRHMVSRAFLNGSNHIFLGLLVRFLFRPALHLLDQDSSFVFHFIFNNFQQIIFCLFGG